MARTGEQSDASGPTRGADGPPARGRAEKLAGKTLMIMTLVSFMVVGLLLNCLQLVLQLTARLSNSSGWRRAHKRLNGQLVYAIFAQPIFILYAWSRVQLSITLADVRLLEELRGDFLGIIVANHTFELDWMACFIMADQLGNMGAYKCFSKAELKYLPIIGWAFWMSDLIYVTRDWSRDKLRLAGQLDQLLDYRQMLLGIFAEGTRWTPEKQRHSEEFARSRQLEPFKRHLFPRPRGFIYTLRHFLRIQAHEPHRLAHRPVRLLNVEIALPDNPNFADFLEGRQLRADIVCEEVPLSAELRAEAASSRDENDCPRLTELLRDIYRRKDEMLAEYERRGEKFVVHSRESGPFVVRRPVKAFLFWLAGMTFTYGTFAYLALTKFARSSAFWSCVLLILVGGALLLKRIQSESKPKSPAASSKCAKTV